MVVGEGAVPQFLAIFWHQCVSDPTVGSDRFLTELLSAILTAKLKPDELQVPGPYYSVGECVLHHCNVPDKTIDASFDGSYTLEAILHLVVRRLWKQHVRHVWPDVTRMVLRQFQCAELWHYYRWRNEAAGSNATTIPTPTKNWGDLRSEANDVTGGELPPLIKNYPILLLLFLIVYPHRITSSAIRWLDEELT